MAHLLHTDHTCTAVLELLEDPRVSELPLKDVSLLCLVPIFTSLLCHAIGEHVIAHDLNDSVLID